MPVASPDILSSEGDYLFMRSQPMDLMGRRSRIRHLPLDEQRGPDAHLFVPNGFLDDNGWHRAFWVYGRSVLGGPGKPSGGKKGKRRSARAAFATRWSVEGPVRARAMVKAGDTVFVCGPADIVNERQFADRKPNQLETLRRQAELFTGNEGSVLWAMAASDGAKIGETPLDVLPVFDGMIAGGGKLFLSTVDGKVVCLGGSASAAAPPAAGAHPGERGEVLLDRPVAVRARTGSGCGPGRPTCRRPGRVRRSRG